MDFGGTSVQRTLAQGLPVAISFGWLLYPLQALIQFLSTGRFMPAADVDSIVVNAKTGYARTNKSWVLGRFLRDWDYSPTTTKGLYITIVDAVAKEIDQDKKPDDIFVVISTHFLIFQGAAFLIRLVAGGENATCLLLFFGTLSTILLASCNNWPAEKFNCRKDTSQDYCLTSGNGSPHVLIVRGNGFGFNFEDMATNRDPSPHRRSPDTLSLLLLNCTISALLFAVIALKGLTTFSSAFLFLGTCQNIIAAGARRSAAQHGFHVKACESIHAEKVIEALAMAEEKVEGAGFALLPVFFPGKVREVYVELLEKAKAKREEKEVEEGDSKVVKEEIGSGVANSSAAGDSIA